MRRTVLCAVFALVLLLGTAPARTADPVQPPLAAPPSAAPPFAKGPPIAAMPLTPEQQELLGDEVPLTETQQAALDAMQDIREVRPPVRYGWDPRWGVGVVVAVLVAAAVGLLWWLRRRRRPASPAPREAREVPPEERARVELEALVREAGLGDKEFYYRLCGALRLLLDGRYGADTLERTTEELVPVLRGLPLDDATRASLVELFRAADPVRYADGGASAGRRGADLELARRLLAVPAGEAG